MPKATFHRDHEFYPRWPSKTVLIAYRAGETYENMTRRAVDDAVAAEAAIEDKAPRRRRKNAE